MANNYNSFKPYDRPFTLNGDTFILGRECDSTGGGSDDPCTPPPCNIDTPEVTVTLTEIPYQIN